MSTTNTSGRRKTAVARIYLAAGSGNITVNGKDYTVYFPTLPLQYIATQSLNVAESLANFDVKVNVQGGGVKGQAEAVRLAIAKALVELDPEVKPALRAKGLMTRDDRMVERKKPGRRKARRRFQFSKR
ncbi:30S ribosomal protein S9 [Sphingobacterium sp. lm-10]|uniref:30S ribosomal protein S9 n=1 Tax=Sphingobacterium corticibacter TaxID=2171749 RepID=A0A2T8HLK7_9SPHI|nr:MULTISPECIES: 30S ribosomal protein S9 [Sphingobacterium]MCL7988003.1 30S ribosomal protein S9 [Sphingobacterium sp. lm-10]PVH26331.1 30S ribosomal protein S9 [Sphingobacterium corticibacter]